MIRYALACTKGHTFESWFQSSETYEEQRKRDLVTCPICGDAKVDKAIMSPKPVGTRKRGRAAAPAVAPVTADTPVATPADDSKAPMAMISPQEREFRQKLKDLREHLVKNSDYVGPKFSEEARKMHYGEIDARSIYGEASPQEAKDLHEEGIQFHPIPVLPDDRN
jgi:hypothetical protein